MVAHLLAVFAIWLVDVQGARWGILVLLGSAYYYLQKLRVLRISAIAIDEQGYRLLCGTIWMQVALVSAFITAPLTVAVWQDALGQRYALTLLPDSLSTVNYRHLRVRLRWHQR
ncbi:MAG: hypothetical protein HOP20_07025 [Sulfuriferula sp.]|nr:hypothetical protein [Sulfuriferula sp.]